MDERQRKLCGMVPHSFYIGLDADLTLPIPKHSLSSSHNPSATRYSAHPLFLRTQMDKWQQMATKTMWHDATFVLRCPRCPYPQHMYSHIPSVPETSARDLLRRSTPTPIPSTLQTSTRGLRRQHMHTPPAIPENTCTHTSLPFTRRARGVFLNNPHPTLIPSASLFYHPPRSRHSTVNIHLDVKHGRRGTTTRPSAQIQLGCCLERSFHEIRGFFGGNLANR